MRYSMYKIPDKTHCIVVVYNGSPKLVTDIAFTSEAQAIQYLKDHRRLRSIEDNEENTLSKSAIIAEFDTLYDLEQTHPEIFI